MNALQCKVILQMIYLLPNKENYQCVSFAKNQFKILKKCLFARDHAISYFINIVLLN